MCSQLVQNNDSNESFRPYLINKEAIAQTTYYLEIARVPGLHEKNCSSGFQVIYQTREGVFHQISKHWEVGCKNEAQPIFFKRLRGVWTSDETHFRVFDMASQMINSWRNSRLNFAKFYGN